LAQEAASRINKQVLRILNRNKELIFNFAPTLPPFGSGQVPGELKINLLPLG